MASVDMAEMDRVEGMRSVEDEPIHGENNECGAASRFESTRTEFLRENAAVGIWCILLTNGTEV